MTKARDLSNIPAGGGDFNVDSDTLFVDASENKIAIGTTDVGTDANTKLNIFHPDEPTLLFERSSGNSNGAIRVSSGGLISFLNGADTRSVDALSERMRIDSSGNLLVGATSLNIANTGHGFGAYAYHTRSGEPVLYVNRTTSDGSIIELRKDNATVGSIGADSGDLYIGTGSHGIRFADGSSDIRPFATSTGFDTNGTTDLGTSGARFREIFATNGTINVSDINEKQDIEELSEVEKRVAVAAKGLLRKFRWKDMVAEKGDDARIHFGIMAQDLQAAFEAEGLDAGRYSMFIKETYYELLTDVPAVEAQDAVYETVVIPAVTEERLVSEAVLDEEGNEIEAAVYETVVVQEETTEERLVSEAVEARDAYTRRRVYKAHEEIPEGAQAVTTYGVRYSELLAFIIAAI